MDKDLIAIVAPIIVVVFILSMRTVLRGDKATYFLDSLLLDFDLKEHAKTLSYRDGRCAYLMRKKYFQFDLCSILGVNWLKINGVPILSRYEYATIILAIRKADLKGDSDKMNLLKEGMNARRQALLSKEIKSKDRSHNKAYQSMIEGYGDLEAVIYQIQSCETKAITLKEMRIQDNFKAEFERLMYSNSHYYSKLLELSNFDNNGRFINYVDNRFCWDETVTKKKAADLYSFLISKEYKNVALKLHDPLYWEQYKHFLGFSIEEYDLKDKYQEFRRAAKESHYKALTKLFGPTSVTNHI